MEGYKLPKYYSSKLITRNQSNFNELGAIGLDLESNGGNEDLLKLADDLNKANNLKSQDYVNLMGQTPGHVTETSPSFASHSKKIRRSLHERNQDKALGSANRQT